MRDKHTWIIYEINHDGEFSNLRLGIGAPCRGTGCTPLGPALGAKHLCLPTKLQRHIREGYNLNNRNHENVEPYMNVAVFSELTKVLTLHNFL
jgi:hypothetical protein